MKKINMQMKRWCLILLAAMASQIPFNLKGQVQAPYFEAVNGNLYADLEPGYLLLRHTTRSASIFPSSQSLDISTDCPRFIFISNYAHPTGGAGNLAKWYYRTNGTPIEVMSLETSGSMTVKYLPNIGDYKNMQYNSVTGEIGWDNSSKRSKTNISSLEDDWSKILNVRPVKYTRPRSPDYWEYGYVAEEMDSIDLKNLVGYDADGIPDDVHYDKMVVYLTEMIKIQQNSISELAEKLNIQQQMLEEHQNLMIGQMQQSKKNRRQKQRSCQHDFSQFTRG
ncbi:MAG: tail fiber domain-containing protein [Saprospiraceae bacterium]|nr:tail fiber domain-containing protein [Saprospiraceae bacterium]